MKPKSSQSEMTFFALAILNSRLMTFYHRAKFLDQTKTTFQKILVKDAKCFPIVVNNKRLIAKIASLGEKQATKFVDRRDDEIDELVYELYGISGREKKMIENYFEKVKVKGAA